MHHLRARRGDGDSGRRIPGPDSPAAGLKRSAPAFADTALESFVVPSALRVIKAGAFMGCKNLREVKLNEGCPVEIGRRLPLTVQVVTAQLDTPLWRRGTEKWKSMDSSCK